MQREKYLNNSIANKIIQVLLIKFFLFDLNLVLFEIAWNKQIKNKTTKNK